MPKFLEVSDTAAARAALEATTVGSDVFTAEDADEARTALGATTVGSDLFTATDAADARTTIGATTVGSNVITAADAAAARTAIGAGTSNLTIGTTSTTAKAGDYQPSSSNISDSTATGRALITAATETAARAAISAEASSAATFNVKDYGAVGDSVVDDTDAVQAAIDAAEAYAATGTWVRATVFFPSGTYKINGSLTVVGDAIAFAGVDVSSSFITRTVLSATPIILVQGEGFHMQNLYFRWTSGDPWWQPEQSVVLRLEHPQSGAYNNSVDAFINACRMSGFHTGVSIYGQGLTVTDCSFGRMTNAFVLDFPEAADLLDKGDDDQHHVESGFRTFRFSDIHTQAVDTFIDNTGPNATHLRNCVVSGFTSDLGVRLWKGVMAGTVVTNFNVECVTSNANPIPVFDLYSGSKDSVIMNGRYVGRQEITGATNPGGVGTSTITERAVKNFLTCSDVSNLSVRNLHVQNVREEGFHFTGQVHGLFMSNVHFQDVSYSGGYRQIRLDDADTQAYFSSITFDIPASNTITPIGGYDGTSSTVIIGSNLVQVDTDHITDHAIYDVGSTIVINGAAREQPAGGSWKKGEVVWNRLSTVPLGWLCTASGSPGTWEEIQKLPDNYVVSQIESGGSYPSRVPDATNIFIGDSDPGLNMDDTADVWANPDVTTLASVVAAAEDPSSDLYDAIGFAASGNIIPVDVFAPTSTPLDRVFIGESPNRVLGIKFPNNLTRQVSGCVTVPPSWVTARVVVRYMHTTEGGTGNVRFAIDITPFGEEASIDGGSQHAHSNAVPAANQIKTKEFDSSGTIPTGGGVAVTVARNGLLSADTFEGDMYLVGVYLERTS